MRRLYIALLMLGFQCLTTPIAHAEVQVPIYSTQTDGETVPVGRITFRNTDYGLLIEPALTGLPAGLHGFHLHQHPDCANHGMAAGGHYDPQETGKHAGPYRDDGHLGDLPPLYVATDGTASVPTLAPRLTEADLSGLSVMIHAGGDNFSDTPEPLGGGGQRIACGPIQHP